MSVMTTSSKSRCINCGQRIDTRVLKRENHASLARVWCNSLVQGTGRMSLGNDMFKCAGEQAKRTMGMYQGRYDLLSTWRGMVCR